jgi:hypothetical protein
MPYLPYLITTFFNEEKRIEARIFQTTAGFSVSLFNAYAGEYYPTVEVFKTENEAITAAKVVASS